MKNFIFNMLFLLKSMFRFEKIDFSKIGLSVDNSKISVTSRISAPADILDVTLESHSYISKNSTISFTEIGKFTSIGPNFICGFGIHPIHSVSSSPMFYSKEGIKKFSFTNNDSFEMRKKITIGNDVFIGSNVTIIDGVVVGDGAVIGAGAVVTKNIPPYAIVVGVPAKIIKYRFDQDVIDALQKIQWWNWSDDKLKNVTKDFYDVNLFIENNLRK